MAKNRLSDSTSPYLLQHADNPVDWFPWGPAAFEEARRRDVPIFLSVGYSSCHWCHVMAHESFEDDAVAAVLNDRFVNVKVDREERPDVDAVYMDAVTAMTGHGGWPMSVFMTPDGEPIYAGTYWPPERRQGMPAFLEVVDAVHDAWSNRRDEAVESAQRLTSALVERARTEAADALDLDVAEEASRLLREQAADRRHGGFGRAPKFPQAMVLAFLLERFAATGEHDELVVAGQALDAMARGGIHDHVGGGFARYATDAAWLVPHFEKMLYDNALLAPCYAQAYALAGDERFDRTARSTCDYLLRELRHEGGAFFSATDADSEGVEGRFFVWSYGELVDVIAAAGADPDVFTAYFGATREGNWEDTNILHEPVPRETFPAEHDLDPDVFLSDLERVRAALYEHRSQRVPPGLDDKILTSWNALAIRGLARTGALLGEPRFVEAALAAARFVEDELVVDGRLHHTWKDGRASVPAFLEDVALLASAHLDLLEITGDRRWYLSTLALAEDALERFRDPDGGFFQTAHDAEQLLRRPKDTWDNAQPSGNSAMADVAARLAALTGDTRWQELAEEIVLLFQDDIRRAPTGFGELLRVVEFLRTGPREVAIVGPPGPDRDRLVATYRRRPRPGTVLVVADGPDETVPLLAARGAIDGRPAAYVCHGFVCQRPVTDPDELAALLAG